MTKDLAVRDKGTLRALFDDPEMQEGMREMLSKYITPERILKAALVAVSKNPKLFDCTKESWAMAFIKMAELGLDCSGATGRGYLVPYWNKKLKAYEAQFIPGYGGFIDTAVREGLATYIECDVVYERDRFKFIRGTTPVFEHEPYLPKPGGKDGRGEIIAAYSLAHLANGGVLPEVMDRSELEKVKKFAMSKFKETPTFGPWIDWFSQMCRKTPIRRQFKYLPQASVSEAVQKLIAHDNKVDGVIAYAGLADDGTRKREEFLISIQAKIDVFKQWGIPQETLLKALKKKKIEDCTEEDWETLHEYFLEITEGGRAAGDLFPVEKKTNGGKHGDGDMFADKDGGQKQ